MNQYYKTILCILNKALVYQEIFKFNKYKKYNNYKYIFLSQYFRKTIGIFEKLHF